MGGRGEPHREQWPSVGRLYVSSAGLGLRRSFVPMLAMKMHGRGERGERGGVLIVMHACSDMTIDPRIPTTPGRGGG